MHIAALLVRRLQAQLAGCEGDAALFACTSPCGAVVDRGNPQRLGDSKQRGTRNCLLIVLVSLLLLLRRLWLVLLVWWLWLLLIVNRQAVFAHHCIARYAFKCCVARWHNTRAQGTDPIA
jgi:hypothetical protein